MSAKTVAMRLWARSSLLTLTALTLLAGATLVSFAADDTMVDPGTLPRLEGAKDDAARSSEGKLVYSVPGSVPNTVAAVRKLLADAGWSQYVAPLDEKASSLLFKKGPRGLLVQFTMSAGRSDESSVTYYANRLNTDLPFPDAPADVVFESNRPYLSLVAAGPVEAMLDFYDKSLTASGWSRLSAGDAASRWPNAVLADKIENGVLAYYWHRARSYQKPIEVSLQRREDGRTRVEIRVASFALPLDLQADSDTYGMPKPKESRGSSATNGRVRKEMRTLLPAEIGVALAFYRRELALRNWKEDNAVINTNEASLTFTSDEGKASLRLSRQYDLIVANLVIQVSEAMLAAQEKAKRDESTRFMREAQEQSRQVIAADEARRAAANAAAAARPAESVRALAENPATIPLPETASDISFERADGRLEYASPSSVKTLAEFHRAAMKQLGWSEQRSVINNPNMVVMNFAKGAQKLSMTVMQLGPKARVTADGSGLKSTGTSTNIASNAAAPGHPAETELEAVEASGFPVPKGYTLSAPGSWAMKGDGQTPFRRDFVASVPANLPSVLGFYRRELSKREWRELPQGAVVKDDKVQLAFAAPEGPAMFKLERSKGETRINIVVKNPAEAAKAAVLPPAGGVKLVFGNMGDADVAITIAGKTIKVAPGTGGPDKKDGPTMELRPGKYKFSLKATGRPAHADTIEVAADETWGLMVSPRGDDALTLQLY